MSKYQYFELGEFIKSDIAKKKGIDNTPTFEIVDNLNELVRELLDPLRAAYGKPIRVSSGFRCEKLNAAVKGAKTSVHKRGSAADLQPIGDTFSNFKDFVVNWFKTTGKKFDQLLIEHDTKTGDMWLHIGQYNNAGQQRGQIKVMEVSK